VRGAGKHREQGTWQADEIACHPAAEQAKQLDRVLGADNIRIPDGEQRGRLDRKLLFINQAKIGECSDNTGAPVDHHVAPRLLPHLYKLFFRGSVVTWKKVAHVFSPDSFLRRGLSKPHPGGNASVIACDIGGAVFCWHLGKGLVKALASVPEVARFF